MFNEKELLNKKLIFLTETFNENIDNSRCIKMSGVEDFTNGRPLFTNCRKMPIRYKCRVEIQVDFFRFWKKFLKFQKIYDTEDKYHLSINKCEGDEWTFDTEMNLDEIIDFTRDITDCHILRQSVQLEKDFNGERIWDRG